MNSDLSYYLAQERVLSAITMDDALVASMDKKIINENEKTNPIRDGGYYQQQNLANEKHSQKIDEDKCGKEEAKKTEKADQDKSEKEIDAGKYLSSLNGESDENEFDTISEDVDFGDEESIRDAFDAYRSENTPPLDINDILDEEKFHIEDKNGDSKAFVIGFSIPEIEKDEEVEELKSYFVEFLDRIGVENPDDDVNVNLIDDGHGGSMCEFSICHKIK